VRCPIFACVSIHALYNFLPHFFTSFFYPKFFTAMKKALLLAAAFTLTTLCLPSRADASVYIKYYNKDSQKYVWKVKMNGSTKEVTFDGSTSSAATIGGSGTSCIVETPCGNIELKDNMKIEIHKGCIKIM
jgi:hypothetical protein